MPMRTFAHACRCIPCPLELGAAGWCLKCGRELTAREALAPEAVEAEGWIRLGAVVDAMRAKMREAGEFESMYAAYRASLPGIPDAEEPPHARSEAGTAAAVGAAT